MKESWEARWLRWRFNFFPAYRRTGARIVFIAPDYREVRIRLALNWSTKNHNGTIFGGSLYAALDPVFVMMLFFILRNEKVIIWTKVSHIDFLRPGRSTLYANFILPESDIKNILLRLKTENKVDCDFKVELVDKSNVVTVRMQQTVSIRKSRS